MYMPKTLFDNTSFLYCFQQKKDHLLLWWSFFCFVVLKYAQQPANLSRFFFFLIYGYSGLDY